MRARSGRRARLLAHMAAAERFTDGLADHPRTCCGSPTRGGRRSSRGPVPPRRRDARRGRGPAHRRLAVARAPAETSSHRIARPRHAAGPRRRRTRRAGCSRSRSRRSTASYVLWFRPEVVRTVSWGGDPRKPVEPAASGPAAPAQAPSRAGRRRCGCARSPGGRARSRRRAELRNAIVGIVLRRAEELASLTDELQRAATRSSRRSPTRSRTTCARRSATSSATPSSCASTRASGSPSAGRRYLDTIIESAFSAGTLVDDLLSFSQMGRARLQPVRIDMQRAGRRGPPAARCRRRPAADQAGGSATCPPRHGDPVMLRLALVNLLSNALKYTRPREEAVIDDRRAARARARRSTPCATTASASTWPTPTSCSASSSGCTGSRSSRAPASGSPTCAASSSATAAASGRRARSTAAPTFYFALPHPGAEA